MLRKLEFYREGHSAKHVADIRAIHAITGLDPTAMRRWLDQPGLAPVYREVIPES